MFFVSYHWKCGMQPSLDATYSQLNCSQQLHFLHSAADGTFVSNRGLSEIVRCNKYLFVFLFQLDCLFLSFNLNWFSNPAVCFELKQQVEINNTMLRWLGIFFISLRFMSDLCTQKKLLENDMFTRSRIYNRWGLSEVVQRNLSSILSSAYLSRNFVREVCL